MNRIDRYKILIRHAISEGIIQSQKDLGQMLGYMNESYFSQIINGKVQEPKDFIGKLCDIIPELNSDWLSTGEGDMLREQSGQGNINIHRSSLNNSPINSTATVEAFLSELGAQRRLTEKTIEQVSRSQDQIDRLITLLEQRQ